MSKPKPRPTLPPPIPTLPSGDLDCPPELPALTALETIAAMSREELRIDIQRDGELRHERNLTAIRSQGQRLKMTATTKSPNKARGRRPSPHVGQLEAALLRRPGTTKPQKIDYWLIYLNSKNPPIMFPVPDSSPPSSISYPAAWRIAKYRNTIRKRLKKILEDRLLPA